MMKNTRSLITLLMVIGLIAVFLVSTDTFALDPQTQKVRNSQQITVQEKKNLNAPRIFVCPQKATLRTTMEILNSGSEWQPDKTTIGTWVTINDLSGVSVVNGVIYCIYKQGMMEERSMLRRNWPEGYTCAAQTSPPNTVICTPLPSLKLK